MNARLVALFYLTLLLFSPLSAAVPVGGFDSAPSEQIPAPSPAAFAPTPGDVVISFQAAGPGVGGVAACSFSQLSPEEVQRFKDGILTPGLIADEISSGEPPNANRDKVSDRNTLLVPNPGDSETAFQKEVPTEVLDPSELSPLQNQLIRGPIAFGLSLDDSLRAARCENEEDCSISGDKLQYRNSGEGISGNVKNIYSAVTGNMESEDSVFTEEESDYLQAQIAGEQVLETEDANQLNAEFYTRNKNPNVMNHVRVDNTLEAGLLTNCDNGSCIISVYSMFDKYFNSWFSGELVIGTFAPTAWGQFRKMLVRSKRYSLLEGKIAAALNPLDVWKQKKISNYASKVAGEKSPIGPNDFFTRYKGSGPAEISGSTVLDNYKRALLRDVDAASSVNELFGQKKFVSLGSTSQIADAAFGPNGSFTNIKDLETRQKLFTFWSKVKEHATVSKALHDVAMDPKLTPEFVDRGRLIAKINKDFDDAWKLDLVELSRIEKAPEWNEFTFQNNAGTTVNWIYDDDKYYKDAYEQFYSSGRFTSDAKNFGATQLADLKYASTTLPDGRVVSGFQLYKTNAETLGSGVDLLRVQKGEYQDQFVLLSDKRVVPANPDTYSVIKADQDKTGFPPLLVTKKSVSVAEPPKLPNGQIDWSQVVNPTTGEIDYAKLGVMTPELFTQRLLAGGVLPGKIKNAQKNADYIYETMVSRDWGKGSYTNILSKQLQTQENLLKNYINIFNPNVGASGIGWTAKMYGYWWLTRGFGSDKFSIYQLPEEWTEVHFDTGQSDLYDDAYVDFFANEGSDTGDIFQRVISNFPVPALVIEPFAAQYEPLQKAWNAINAGTGRTKPDNLAMFLFGADSCPGCSASIYSPTDGRFDVQYISPESVNSFFLEHAKTEEAREEGQLLTLFSHHMNVKGQLKGEELDPIDLVNARANEETCEQVSEDLFLYGNAAKLIGAEKTGAAIAAVEHLSYLMLGMGGTLVTLANQIAIAPKLNECVDDKEGYFSSLFVPVSKEVEGGKADEIQKGVSQNALDGIRSFTEQVDQENDSPSLPEKVLQEATGKVRELVDDAQDTGVAEAELRVTGGSSGYFKSEEVIYFWVGGDGLIQPSKYNTEGSTFLTTEDGHTILLDNEDGTLTVDGQTILGEESADHTRLSNKNLSIPAVEIPQRLNGFALSDTNEWLFTVNIRGEALIQDPDLLNCIQAAVLEQSGVGLNSNNMSEAFGLAESVVTDTYPNIALEPLKNRILLGGRVPQIASGAGARIDVFANRNVIVSNAPNPNVGKFQSALFENGSIIYKPETNELLIWLRHHANAVVSDQDVQDFSGTLTNTKNPLTACDEPAIDLSVETDPSTPASKLKGDNLTAGLEKNGPFQVFETDSKRFILYSKLVDGECKEFFKVVDKETGEVYDQEITGISQNEDGTISIKTADGQTHSLKFTDENGKPVLTYDGQSELLRSASGKGGSFYYDPNKGLYFAENAQLIPLNDNFKNQGVSFQANPDGTASGKAGDNVFNINTGQGSEGLFNIPSIPETAAGALLFLLALGMLGAGIFLDARNGKARREMIN